MLVMMAALPCRGVRIDPAHSVITIADRGSSIQRLAAAELQKHLELITGIRIPVGEKADAEYTFHIGMLPPGSEPSLNNREEGFWWVFDKAAYFYGDDFQPYRVKEEGDVSLVSQSLTRSGTLFAVYDFLENVLGVHWIMPGDQGIIYSKDKILNLPAGKEGGWVPALAMRQIRSGYNWDYYKKRLEKATPEMFRISEDDYRRLEEENRLWLKRMRMGRHLILNYGHAFTDWWEKYGKTHPEYFALNEKGTREPLRTNQPDRIKMCVSNPGLHEQIVRDWREKKEKAKFKQMFETINVCENDSAGFCVCPDCLALDARKPGEELTAHLTDRYVYLANKVTELASASEPGVYSVMYAYAYYRFPPRKIKVNPRVIIGAVPFMLSPPGENEAFYRDWRAAGVEKIFLRPNDQHLATGLPMGFEKAMFDAYKLGIDNGIIGTDYDSLYNFWPVCGMGDYILAKAHVDPAKPFEYWENEYCSAYGAAAPEVKAYFAYWRDAICRKKLLQAMPKILEQLNGNNLFRTGIFRDNLHNYYTSEDFDRTDRILEQGAARNLSERQKALLEQLVLANRHARLTHQALLGAHGGDYGASRKLLDFRIANRNRLNMYWPYLFHIENTYNDITGVQRAYADMNK